MQNLSFINEPWYLLTVALGAVLALLFLIVRARLHAFIALSLVSLVTALVAGISVMEVVPTLMSSFGGTGICGITGRLRRYDRQVARSFGRCPSIG